MFAVVVDRMTGEPEALARAAAGVLGGTAYDMRASMNVPAGGPAVLSVVADAAVAEQHRAGLQQAGFCAAVQTQTLGHTLPPAQHLDFAVDLVARSLRGRG